MNCNNTYIYVIPFPRCHFCTSPSSLLQLGRQGQVARRATDPDGLGSIGDDPVLSVDIPVAEVTTGELNAELNALARGDALNTVESTKDTDRLTLTTVAEVQLGNLIGHSLTSVCNSGSDLVHDIPELTVTTGLTTSRVLVLRGGIGSVRRQELLSSLTILGVAAGGLARRGVVGPRVDELANLAETGRETVVLQVLAESAKRRGGDGLTLGRRVRTRVALSDLEVGVLKGRPRQTETELVQRSLVAGARLARVFLVKVAVIKEGTVLKVVLGSSGTLGLVDDLVAVASLSGTPGEGRASRRGLSVEDISNRVTRFLTRLSSPEDGGNIGVLMPVFDKDSTRAVDNNDGVLASVSNGVDELVAVAPEGQVVAVTLVALKVDVTLTALGVDKDNGSDVGLADESLGGIGLVVAEDAFVASSVLDSLVLESSVGGNEVRELRSTRSPLHGDGTIVAATVVAPIGALKVGTSVITNNGNELGLVQRKGTLVLENDGSLGSGFTDVAGVVAADINTQVDLLVTVADGSVAVAELIAGPRREGSLDLVLECLANLEVRSHDTHNHVVHSVGGNGAVEDGDGQVGTPVAETSVEHGVTGHGHVEAGNSSGGTRVLGLPIAHDETLETVFVLEETVESLGVLASVGVVDLVVGAHDGADTSLDSILEGPSVVLVHELIVDVGGEGLGAVGTGVTVVFCA